MQLPVAYAGPELGGFNVNYILDIINCGDGLSFSCYSGGVLIQVVMQAQGPRGDAYYTMDIVLERLQISNFRNFSSAVLTSC